MLLIYISAEFCRYVTSTSPLYCHEVVSAEVKLKNCCVACIQMACTETHKRWRAVRKSSSHMYHCLADREEIRLCVDW